MTEIKRIGQPVENALEQFNTDYKASLQSQTALLQKAIDRLMEVSGKHVRPLLLLLTAKACGETNQTSINAAVLIELLHAATLIHDDVVDDTKQRRGVPSLNAIFDNRIAVLVGDFVLSTALIRSIQTGDLRIIGLVSDLGRDLSEGEIKQLESADERVMDESVYLQVIRKKTAALLSSCAMIGAISAKASEETVENCRLFGEYLGYAFQIRDDLFDYYTDTTVGKPTGNDIREGKVTLPLLYALRNGVGEERDALLDIILKQDYSSENIEHLISFAKANGGIEYAEQRMREYIDLAKKHLETLPSSEALDSLKKLANYIIDRKK